MARLEAKRQVQLPTLSQKPTGGSPIYPPTGGFYSNFGKLNLIEPVRTWNANTQLAKRRALGTIPMNAMTKDVHSYMWERI